MLPDEAFSVTEVSGISTFSVTPEVPEGMVTVNLLTAAVEVVLDVSEALRVSGILVLMPTLKIRLIFEPTTFGMMMVLSLPEVWRLLLLIVTTYSLPPLEAMSDTILLSRLEISDAELTVILAPEVVNVTVAPSSFWVIVTSEGLSISHSKNSLQLVNDKPAISSMMVADNLPKTLFLIIVCMLNW